MEILGEGLLFPEGPIAFPDGSVVLVEILGGRLTRVWNGKSEVICDLGGGPNGAALGPDGAVYVCNSGGFDWRRGPEGGVVVDGILPREKGGGGRIERVDLSTGKSERIYESVGGHPLSAPNDLVFDAAGGFWFTDLGHTHPRHRDKSGLYYAKPDGSFVEQAHYDATSFNGVGLSPDGKTLYVADTWVGRLFAFAIEAPGRVAGSPRTVGVAPSEAKLDSLAVTAAGNVCVGGLQPGGVITFEPGGGTSVVPLPDPYVTNICFGGADLKTAIVTLSITGKLVSLPWPEPGLALNFPAA